MGDYQFVLRNSQASTQTRMSNYEYGSSNIVVEDRIITEYAELSTEKYTSRSSKTKKLDQTARDLIRTKKRVST